MTWNYRIVKRLDGSFAVHEVYYNEDKEAWGMTEEPVLRFVAFPNEDKDLHENENDIKKVLDMIHKDVHRAPVFEEPHVWASDDCDDEGDEDLVELDELLDKENKE